MIRPRGNNRSRANNTGGMLHLAAVGSAALRVAAGTAVVGFGLAACGSSTSAPPAVTSLDGEELFSMRSLGGQPGCVTCHSLTPDHRLVGPSLAGVATRAETRVDGMEATDYLRTSIVDPNQFVVEGFEPGKMPQVFADILSEEQITALIDYLSEVEG